MPDIKFTLLSFSLACVTWNVQKRNKNMQNVQQIYKKTFKNEIKIIK